MFHVGCNVTIMYLLSTLYVPEIVKATKGHHLLLYKMLLDRFFHDLGNIKNLSTLNGARTVARPSETHVLLVTLSLQMDNLIKRLNRPT